MEFLCANVQLFLAGDLSLSEQVAPMPKRHDDDRETYPRTWPFPIGSWVLPAFWLVVVLLASLAWLFN